MGQFTITIPIDEKTAAVINDDALEYLRREFAKALQEYIKAEDERLEKLILYGNASEQQPIGILKANG